MIEGLWNKTTVENHIGLSEEHNFCRGDIFDVDSDPL